jgi:hypothetical protein
MLGAARPEKDSLAKSNPPGDLTTAQDLRAAQRHCSQIGDANGTIRVYDVNIELEFLLRVCVMKTMFLAVLLLTSLSTRALAQVPPHTPGTICVTPIGWCWLPAVNNPGGNCWCGSHQGRVS